MEKISIGMPKDVMQNNSLTKRVLYGAWDVTKKAGKIIESQGPRAWNERIIKTINEKIIPKLTPDQLSAVAKHHRAIEVGAQVAGVVISSAELYTAFFLAGLAQRKISLFRTRRLHERTLTDVIQRSSWFQDIRHAFMGITGHRPEHFAALASSLAFMADAIFKEKSVRESQHAPWKIKEKPAPGFIGILYRANSPKQAEESLRAAYRRAHHERVTYEASLRGKHPPGNEDIDKEADTLFGQWKATRFRGAEGLLEAANVQNKTARRAFMAIQGLHAPRLFDNEVVLPEQALQAITKRTWRKSDFVTEKKKGEDIQRRISSPRYTNQG